MHEQLSGSLRHIQIVFEELVQGVQGLFIQVHRYIVTEDLLNKDLAQIHRQLIDQTSDSQRAVGDHLFLCVEDLAYIQCHLGFLVRLGYVLQFLYHGAICHLHIQKSLRIHHGYNSLGQFMQYLRCGGALNRFDQDQA